MALDEAHEPGVNGRRYVVVGAGAIGGTVGGVLARAGVPTGLTLRTPDGIFHTPVTAVPGAEHVRLTSDDVLGIT